MQLRKGFLVSKGKIFLQGSVILANIVWFHVNNYFKGVVACLYQEEGITRGPITRGAYNRDFTVFFLWDIDT